MNRRAPAARALLALAPVSLVTALALAAPAAASEATRTVEHSVAATGTVRIANLAGRIDLMPGTGPVKVVAVVHAEGGSAEETRELIDAMRWVQEKDGTWNLAYPVDRYDSFAYVEKMDHLGSQSTVRFRGEQVRVYGGPRWRTPVLFADLTITVPRGSQVVVKNAVGSVRGSHLAPGELVVDTGSGDVVLEDVEGQLGVDTGSGDVELRDLRGDTSADTGSGDVTIDGIEADRLSVDTGSGDVILRNGAVRTLDADTGSGDIRISEVQLEQLRGDTGSGEIEVRGGLADAQDIKLDTGSGDVTLLGGDGFEFDLTTDLGSGEVNIGYDDAEVRRSRHEVVGARRGSGRTRVYADTGSGDVTIAPLGRR